jgi:hypothetical protein
MSRIIEAGKKTAPCKVLLNGEEVQFVYTCRVGSNGWAKRFASTFRLNCKKDEVKKLPILRGKVEIVPL